MARARGIPSPTCAGSRSCWSGPTRRPTGSGRSASAAAGAGRAARGRAGRPGRHAGTLTELSGVGDVTARCVAESLAGEEPVYLRRLAATEGTDLDGAAARAARRAARRLPHPLGLVRRRLADRGDGAGRGRARPRVPGAHRPLAPADRGPRADRRPGCAGSSTTWRSSTRRCPDGLPASSPASRWTSSPTARWTRRTSCWPGSTWWSARCTASCATSGRG